MDARDENARHRELVPATFSKDIIVVPTTVFGYRAFGV